MPTKKTSNKKVAKKPVSKKATKKVVKKTSTKKVLKKKVTKKVAKSPKTKSTKKDLVYSEDHTSFWVSDGQVLNSLLALRDALTEMEREVYLYHATGEQNDFSVWVDSVLCDQGCAKDINKAKTQTAAKKSVVKNLKLYSI